MSVAIAGSAADAVATETVAPPPKVWLESKQGYSVMFNTPPSTFHQTSGPNVNERGAKSKIAQSLLERYGRITGKCTGAKHLHVKFDSGTKIPFKNDSFCQVMVFASLTPGMDEVKFEGIPMQIRVPTATDSDQSTVESLFFTETSITFDFDGSKIKGLYLHPTAATFNPGYEYNIYIFAVAKVTEDDDDDGGSSDESDKTDDICLSNSDEKDDASSDIMEEGGDSSSSDD